MAKVYSIKCPNCGAPLELLGGKNVLSVTCRYCKSVIDLKNNYKILAQFQKEKKIKSPFKVGMQGKVKGIEWTIIGLIVYSTTKGVALKEYWVDHLLYSPIYGYAWLTYENGIVTFTKKVHSLPKKDLSPFNSPKDNIIFDGKVYKFYECYEAYTVYVEGELTFIAKKDDVTQICEAIAPPFGLNKESALGEIEYSISEYLPQEETFKSFKTKPLDNPPWVYPIKPFESKFLKSLSEVSKVFLAISIFIIVAINLISSNKVVAKDSFISTKRVIEFNITNPKHLLEIDIDTNLDNNWLDYELSIEDKNKTEIFATSGEISYYHGYEGGESWSEGSQSETIYTKVPSGGAYKLYFDSTHKAVVNKTITVKEGVIRDSYFIALAIIYLITFLLFYIAKMHYDATLWKEVTDD